MFSVNFKMNVTVSPIDRMSNIYNNSVVRYWQFLFHDLSGKFTRVLLHESAFKKILIIEISQNNI